MMNRRESRLLAVKVLLQKGYEWLACDADGTIVAYEVKPFKMTDDEWWNYDSAEPKFLTLDNAHDINFVKWLDDEPTNIAEWIKKEEEEMNIVTREARFASVDLLLQNGYEWLARDLNGSIAAYSHKPFKLDDEVWYNEIGESKEMWVDDGDLYNFVKWLDDEPVNIREWLEKEEEEMKLYYVGNGGLLTPKEVELDQDNKKESPSNLNANSITTGTLKGSKTWLNSLTGTMQFTNPTVSDKLDQDDCSETIKVNTENSGNSAFYEMAEKFREALDMATDYGYRLSVSIVDDNYTWGYNLPILDFKSTNPTASDKLDQDDCSETIKVTAENWGKSAILEKAEKFREALEMATDYEPPVSIIADQFEYTNKMPRQLSLADLDNVKVHDRICLELNNIYEKKNADYGNSFENSLDKHGMIAGIVRMDDKMSRLISLNSKKEQQVMDEGLRDTLMDLANYAIMSVMWLDDKSGEESDGGYLSPTESKAVSLLDQDSYLLAAGEAFRAGFSDGMIGVDFGADYDHDIYADNQKLDIDKALREGAHPQAIRDFLGGADYDGDTTNS